MRGSHCAFIFDPYGVANDRKGPMKKRTVLLWAAAIAAPVALVGGLTAFGGVADQSTGATPPPSSFTARVDNPWFPLKPGTTYVYRGEKDRQPARDVLTVTHRTKRIDGVPCVVVQDRLYLRGRLEER